MNIEDDRVVTLELVVTRDDDRVIIFGETILPEHVIEVLNVAVPLTFKIPLTFKKPGIATRPLGQASKILTRDKFWTAKIIQVGHLVRPIMLLLAVNNITPLEFNCI